MIKVLYKPVSLLVSVLGGVLSGAIFKGVWKVTAGEDDVPKTTSKRSIAHMSEQTRTALGQQGAAVAQRKRTGGDSPKTRAELYQIAKQRDLPGRSKMGRDELARKLGCK